MHIAVYINRNNSIHRRYSASGLNAKAQSNCIQAFCRSAGSINQSIIMHSESETKKSQSCAWLCKHLKKVKKIRSSDNPHHKFQIGRVRLRHNCEKAVFFSYRPSPFRKLDRTNPLLPYPPNAAIPFRFLHLSCHVHTKFSCYIPITSISSHESVIAHSLHFSVHITCQDRELCT